MASTARIRVPVKTVALPNEHGAWSFLLEPALLGLLLAPSWAGGALVLVALAALLAQHPLSLLLADMRRGKTFPRTRLARQFVSGYGLLALVALAAVVLLADGLAFLVPALLVSPLALVQLALDAQNKGRSLTAELCGAIAVSALAPMIMLLGGSEAGPALALWLLLALRNLSSILYVRARVRLEYGRPTLLTPAIATQFVALVLVGWLVTTGHLPYLALSAFLVLTVRALLGLSRYRRPTAPKYIGMRELGFGLLLVMLTTIGVAGG